MIAVVMTYYQRQAQLNNTLNSFSRYDSDKFFVVIVDDGSPEDIQLTKEYAFDIEIIKVKNKTWSQGDPAYNLGFIHALKKGADTIVIQNAECYHYGDILSHIEKYLDDSNYITYGCYSQGESEEIGSVFNDKCASFDGDSAWYNHPVYRPKAYHFCSAITAGNLKKINGFDERFSFGVRYDDDYLLHQIKTLGLKITITTNPIVIHQWHEKVSHENIVELYNKNHRLYTELIREGNYKAMHLITEDL